MHARLIERGADGASAFGYAAVKLADKGILARNGGLNAAWLQQHSTDIGFAADNMLGTHAIAQHVFCAKSVLQRHHRGVGANKLAALLAVSNALHKTMTRSHAPIPSGVV